MLQPIHKIILQTYCDRHRKLLAFVEKMTDTQLRWLPQIYGNSIAFNLWHLARWADGMQVIFPGMTPELKRRLGERVQIWNSEELAAKWGFQSSQLGFAETGMEMSDGEARRLNFPSKADMLDYARKAFSAVEEVVTAIDEEQFNAPEQLQPLTEGIWGEGTVGDAIFSHIVHDSRHFGMIECLYGMQIGSGTATQ
jgi:hypothetical protein